MKDFREVNGDVARGVGKPPGAAGAAEAMKDFRDVNGDVAYGVGKPPGAAAAAEAMKDFREVNGDVGVGKPPNAAAAAEAMNDFREVLGAERVHERDMSLGGEDFSQFVRAGVPGFYFFLGSAPNEGLFAIAFEIAGPATGPTLRVNPVSGMIPGVMGKLFDFPALDAAAPATTSDR